MVFPSDHHIDDEKTFLDTIDSAVEIAERRRGLVTIGIEPTRPETGYGYIEKGNRANTNVLAYRVERFTEKPNLEVAKDFLLKGTYLWNSGIFIWRADVFLREVEKYLPKLYKNLMEIYAHVGMEDEAEVIKEQYEVIDGISVDFGVLQKTRKAYVIKSEFPWDDIGTFQALSRFLNTSEGNNIKGNVKLEDSENCIAFSKDKLLIGFGVKDLIIVEADNVILVMDRNRDQEVKHLVEKLKEDVDISKLI